LNLSIAIGIADIAAAEALQTLNAILKQSYPLSCFEQTLIEVRQRLYVAMGRYRSLPANMDIDAIEFPLSDALGYVTTALRETPISSQHLHAAVLALDEVRAACKKMARLVTQEQGGEA
jgi:hypothetical protein